MTRIVLDDVTRDDAGHLAFAMQIYRELQKRRGRACPPMVDQLEAQASQVLETGHNRTPVGPRPHDESHEHRDELITHTEAARLIGRESPRTIHRMLERGDIRSTQVGRHRRATRGAVADFLAGDQSRAGRGGEG